MLTRFGQSFNSFEKAHNRRLGKRELFAMSGERNPYQESAWVDMLLAEAYPTKDIKRSQNLRAQPPHQRRQTLREHAS